jgi:hypothetical protein
MQLNFRQIKRKIDLSESQLQENQAIFKMNIHFENLAMASIDILPTNI